MKEDFLKNVIAKELQKVGQENAVYMFISKDENYHLVNTLILQHLVKKLTGICVTMKSGYLNIVQNLRKLNIDVNERLLFVDAVTSKKRKEFSKHKNLILTGSSKSLTDLSIIISEMINTDKFDFLFFDSLEGLLKFNEQELSEKFMHFIINKMRGFNLEGIIISLSIDKDSEKLISTLAPLCDKVIRI